MKAAVVLLALLLTALAPQQQQTFYSAKAEPRPVPAQTAEPVNGEGYGYYGGGGNCSGNGYGSRSSGYVKSGHAAYAPRTGAVASKRGGNYSYSNCGGSRRPMPRPSYRPGPRPSYRPIPRPSLRPGPISSHQP